MFCTAYPCSVQMTTLNVSSYDSSLVEFSNVKVSPRWVCIPFIADGRLSSGVEGGGRNRLSGMWGNYSKLKDMYR